MGMIATSTNDVPVLIRDGKGRMRRSQQPRGVLLPVPPVEQSTAGRCGPACLVMVLRYYGIDANEDDLVVRSGCSRRHGVNAASLIAVARQFGCDGVISDGATTQDLHAHIRERTPVIVDWFSEDDGHYCVVVGIGARKITLLDPAFGGYHIMPLRRFRRVWFDFPGEFMGTPADICLRRMIVIRPIAGSTAGAPV